MSLLSISEVSSIILVFDLCWFYIILQSPELFLIKFLSILCFESLILRHVSSLNELFIDGGACNLRKWKSIYILTLDIGYISLISWYMLSLEISSRSTEPVVTDTRMVTILNLLSTNVLLRWFWVEGALNVCLSANCQINVVVRGFVITLFCEYAIDVTSCAAEYLILFWYVPSIPWQVLLLIGNINHY